MTPRFTPGRAAWLDTLLPEGVPGLWCPLLTHYTADGALDRPRMRAHLDFLQSSVRGLLVPGSTGDGWQLDDAQAHELLDFMLGEARTRGLRLLAGVLKPDTAQMLDGLARTMAWLRARPDAAVGTDAAVLRHAGLCGFAVCPPHGALPQSAIREALDRLLATGLPLALYQLPQVTGNELSASTLAWLADRHANLLMVKDSSGEDRIARDGFRSAWLMRGAEGGYSMQLAASGGAYDGLLLSSANAFGPPLARMLAGLHAGDAAQAHALSGTISAVMAETFAAAAPLPSGNVFTNANKALDHFMAHGPAAAGLPGPRLHGGGHLPPALIAETGAILARHGLMPARGYLDG